MTRRIIQIAAMTSAATEEQLPDEFVFALCNDGTLWCSVSGPKRWSRWAPLPPIPQPEEPTPFERPMPAQSQRRVA